MGEDFIFFLRAPEISFISLSVLCFLFSQLNILSQGGMHSQPHIYNFEMYQKIKRFHGKTWNELIWIC